MSGQRRLLAIAAVVVVLSVSLPAQEPSATFRGGVDVVLVPISVTEKNRPVSGLTAADFELLDQGVVQTFTSVTAESLPVDVTLVLDTSGSVKGPALNRFKSDIQTIAGSLRPTDRVRLITFATDAADVFGLQPGGARLPIENIAAGGATSFYNALAAVLMSTPQTDRPQLVFGMTDGLDTASFLDASHVASLAPHSAATLYLTLVFQTATAALSAPTTAPYQGGPNRKVLHDAVASTGGVMYEKSAGTPLPGLFNQVLQDFRASYVLSYTPRGVARDGWHDLAVHAKNSRYTVRARKGYDGG